MKVEQEINVNRRISRVLTPSAGNMIVNGVEIDGATREEWQKNIAYIPQQPYIFPLSLKITFVSMKQIQRMKKWKEL